MRRHGRGWRGLAVLFVATVSGCATQTDATSVKTRRPGEALRAASAPVPPGQEIEILDPNVDPTGKPAVRLASFAPLGSAPGCAVLPASAPQQQIDVPPTVLVHKFYYTGNRTFQGPMLTGGPVIVSTNHPKTLERVYVPVTLPPGAPRVTYTDDSIRYDFGPQSVTLVFGHCGNPRVRYSQSTNAGETTHKKIAATKAETRSFVQRTGIPEGLQRFKEGTKSTCGAIADRINDAGHVTADVFRNATDFIPGAQLFKSNPEDKAVREQERLQRAAENRPTLDETFVPRAP